MSDSMREESGKTIAINMRFNTAVLGRIDAEARRMGISRTAWLHVAAGKMLKAEAEHYTTQETNPAA